MLATMTGLLALGISLAIPLLLAALGELVVERGGVINVGIEGMALAGAYAAFAAAHAFHSPWVGVAAAIVMGIMLAAFSALLCIVVGADQVVVGTAINILALGLTGVLFRAFFAGPGHAAAAFTPIPLPILCRLRLIGDAFFSQNILGYLAWLLVPATAFFLTKMRMGLHLRAVGEYPQAAEAAGVSVQKFRMAGLLWGGALAGIAGAYLSIAYTNGFVENMTAGRGFIALAVVILGRWKAGGIALAALLFGLADALHYQLQADGLLPRLPYQALQALPYLLTLLALLLRSRLRAVPPAALGEPYYRI